MVRKLATVSILAAAVLLIFAVEGSARCGGRGGCGGGRHGGRHHHGGCGECGGGCGGGGFVGCGGGCGGYASGGYGYGGFGGYGGSMGSPYYGGTMGTPYYDGGRGDRGGWFFGSEEVQAQDAPAFIVVSLPEDARLTIDDHPTTSTSSTRMFSTPALEAGRDFSYTLKAEINKDGQKQVVTRQITVRAGQETRVDLQPTAGSVASR